MNKLILLLFILLLNLLPIKVAYADLVDPTKPTTPTESSNESDKNATDVKNNLQLDAIIFSDTRPVVIINGIVLGINERINGLTIKKIDHQSVVLSSVNGNQTILKFDTLDVKKPPSGKSGN